MEIMQTDVKKILRMTMDAVYLRCNLRIANCQKKIR